ncbi:hypothetical protein [Nonomuraea cypriaca]|nr:hypothetical protein [Nonomuraea cypriaca]
MVVVVVLRVISTMKVPWGRPLLVCWSAFAASSATPYLGQQLAA